MKKEPEDIVLTLLKYFMRQVIERDLMTRNEIWEAYYYAYDQYCNNLETDGCRKPGYVPNKSEILIGWILMAGIDSLNGMQRNSTEWIEDEVLIPIVGMHD